MKKLLIITGEASGDQRAAEVVRDLWQASPELEIHALGGPALQTAGVKIIFDIAELAVMGIVEVMKSLPVIWQAYRRVKRELREWQPEAVLLVDYPGFNLKIAKLAKSLGIRVIYYISPKVWAWKEKRIERIRRDVDVMAVIFPFEVAFYQKQGIKAHYVGCPLLKNIEASGAVKRWREGQPKVLGLLPGSRRSEITRLLPIMLQVAERLSLKDPSLQFLLLQAPGLEDSLFQAYLASAKVKLQVIKQDPYHSIVACDAVICASGTMSLEVGLLGIPQVVIYRVNAMTAWLAKKLIKIPYVSLCNILMGRCIVTEVLQDALTPENLEREAQRILWDTQAIAAMQTDYQALKQQLAASQGQESLVQLLERV